MKALLYKELKLAMHPICYVFVILFPFMILIPYYPTSVGFIYILTCYPILFLGANKGQQSNDLLYTALLPVRKKDIVLARIITVLLLQLTFIAIMSCLYPLAYLIKDYISQLPSDSTKTVDIGFGLDTYLPMLAFAIAGYAIADLIYFSIYYEHGKSIVASTLFTILGFVLYISVFEMILPYAPAYNAFFTNSIWVQIASILVAVVLSFVLHFITYKVASKELEKVDF